eukprot:TRINITY_DN15490_c0_g1_i1.p1 TRINITY_DN15490_c0_g1~~TRINITY_DN15490_c0_g1_i1.p1  ORF type:complete len:119 (+),score=22.71 TRINITY_DN15490_c0_g1_i1:184-540(+)
MVGLSVVLEAQKTLNKRNPQIISKITMLRLSSPTSTAPSTPLPAITFLDACFLCKKRLSPGRDIYMYRGDRAFCTVECRCKQIFMDEESVMKDNCSVAATASRHRKGNRNRAGGMFAY